MPIQTAFNAGELTPQIFGRPDLVKYKNGLRRMTGFICMPHGPATRRPGTVFVAEAKHHDKRCRLVPYQFNVEQAYIHEYGDLYTRFYTDGWQIITAPSTPYEIVTPFTEAQVDDLDFASSADTIYIVNPYHTQKTLVRLAHDNWTLADITFINAPTEWNATDGYPRCISFNNDRLWSGGSPGYPQRLWASEIGIYTSHSVSVPLVDTDALDLTLGAKQANAIQWLAAGRKFSVGTSDGEYWLTSGTGDGAITPTSKDAPIGSFDGCCHVKPVMAANGLIFLLRHQKLVKELKYAYSKDAFEGEEMSQIAEHLLRNRKIIAWCFQREPYRVLWCACDDGTLLGLTYYPEHEVFGWHRHPIGGDGKVESLACIPGTNEDEVWLSVRRTIGGTTKRYIERLHETFTGDDTTDAFFVDSGMTFDSRQNVDSLTYASPGVFNKVAHGLTNGTSFTVRSEDLEVAGEEALLTLHNERFTVANATVDTFEALDEDGVAVDLTAYKTVVSATVAENHTVYTGIDHLEGESVVVLADGAPFGPFVVASGTITLDYAASVVHVGYSFLSEIETFPPEQIDQQTGHAKLGLLKNITHIVFQLHKTLGLKYGTCDLSWFDEYQFSSDTVPAGQAAPLLDGFTDKIAFNDKDRQEPTIRAWQDDPLPCTILAIHSFVEWSE